MVVLPYRSIDGILIGQVVICNPFIDVGQVYKTKDGSHHAMQHRKFDGERKIEGTDPSAGCVVISGTYYTRDMILVKGVDFL